MRCSHRSVAKLITVCALLLGATGCPPDKHDHDHKDGQGHDHDHKDGHGHDHDNK